jgi:hypothetical protein
MLELIKLIRDAIGVRPLIPLILIILMGLAFKSIREYPIKELLYDRYYLLASLTVVFAGIGYLIWTSALAERTPQGRYGIYVARLAGDPNRTIQTRLLEGMAANLAAKANDTNVRIEVKDLKIEFGDQELEGNLPKRAEALNATVIVWGTAIDDKTLYPRLWSQQGGLARSSIPLNVTEISPLAEFAAQAWERIEKVRQTQAGSEKVKSQAELEKDIDALRAEITELRHSLSTGVVAGTTGSRKQTNDKLTAILVGIGDYGGKADLAGPPNDVASLREALKTRNKGWRITTLLNKQATKGVIEEAIRSAAQTLPPDETLLVYFSGHIDPDERGVYRLYTSDIQTSIDVQAIVTQTLKAHARTIFLIDGRFDPSVLTQDVSKRAAVLTAEAQGMAYESFIGGKSQGAFTAALVDFIKAAPEDRSLSLDEVFRSTEAKMKRTYKGVRPRILLGSEPPTL